MPNIEQIISRIRALPPLPAAVQKLCALTEDINATMRDVSQIIAGDESLTAKLLRMVNSAFYSLAEPVTSVPRAVVVLGFSQLRSIMLSMSVMDWRRSSGVQHERRERLWKHAVAVAAIARIVAKQRAYADSEAYFAAGIMHDVGKLVIIDYFPQEDIELCAGGEVGDQTLCALEQQALGADHASIGGMICEAWKLPASLREAVRAHHALLPAEHTTGESLSRTIAIANQLALLLGYVDMGEPFFAPALLSAQSFAAWQEDCTMLVAALPQELAAIESVFGISLRDDNDRPLAAPAVVLADDEMIGQVIALLLISRGGFCGFDLAAIAARSARVVLHDDRLRPEECVALRAQEICLISFAALRQEGIIRPAGVQDARFWQYYNEQTAFAAAGLEKKSKELL